VTLWVLHNNKYAYTPKFLLDGAGINLQGYLRSSSKLPTSFFTTSKPSRFVNSSSRYVRRKNSFKTSLETKKGEFAGDKSANG